MTGKHAAWVDDSGMNCSTIIVGKKASATGRVLVAHNEDDPNCFVQSHLVPRAVHAPGETLTFADGTFTLDGFRVERQEAIDLEENTDRQWIFNE